MRPFAIALATLAAFALAIQASPVQAAPGPAAHGHVPAGVGAALYSPAAPINMIHHPGYPGAWYRRRHYYRRYPGVCRPFPGRRPVVVPFPGHPPVIHPPVCHCPLCYPQRSFYYSGPGCHIGFAY